MPQKNVAAVIVIFFSSCFFFLIGLLFFEYRALIHHNDRLQELKFEYRMHVQEIKRFLTDYHQTKFKLSQLESVLENTDYMHSSVDSISSSTVFDEHMKVFSSDDDELEQQETFVVINRDLEYLKQQSQDYIKQQNLELLFRHVPQDVWLDYTDVALIEKKATPVRPRKAPAKKRIMRSASSSSAKKQQADIFSWPVKRSSFWLSSLYGRRKNANGSWGFHRGIDMAALKGTPVKTAASGIVIEARNAHSGYGKTIVIKHNNKYKTRYAHLNAIRVKVGQTVRRGVRIGDVGDTGFVRKAGRDASHLHFELYVFGERVNPLYYLA